MRRYRRPVTPSTARTPRSAWVHAQTWRTAAIGMTTLALAGCSSFGMGQPDKPDEPNVFPAEYKAGLIAFLQNSPFGLVGAREAALSPPELKAFGNESRYVACLRVAGPDWRKDKMIVYFGGAINQFVDAGEQCNAAAYQPYPELPAMFAQLRSKK
jgi:hypothetical protein